MVEVENARLENAEPLYTNGKRGTGKRVTIIQVGGKRETSSYETPMLLCGAKNIQELVIFYML